MSEHPESRGRRPHLPRSCLIVVLVLAVLLIFGRLVLPWGLKREINIRLGHIPGYSGRVDDVGVQVWHGGYRMYGLVIRKRDGNVQDPFISARRVQFSIAYRELIRGRLVSDVEMENASLNFVHGPTAATSELEADKRWQDVVKDLFPIDITHLHIRDGRIRYVDTAATPRVDIAVDHFQLLADGLRNRPGKRKEGPLPARIEFSGRTIGQGNVHSLILAEPLAKEPHFKLTFSLQNVSLPALNDFLMAYINVDVAAGRFDAYAEATGADGSFQGYVKPFFKDLAFSKASDQKKNAWQRVWKEVVAATANLIKNKQKNQVATLVPISGRFSHGASVDFWSTVGNLLRNGFIQALREGLEGSPSAKKPSPQPASSP